MIRMEPAGQQQPTTVTQCWIPNNTHDAGLYVSVFSYLMNYPYLKVTPTQDNQLPVLFLSYYTSHNNNYRAK